MGTVYHTFVNKYIEIWAVYCKFLLLVCYEDTSKGIGGRSTPNDNKRLASKATFYFAILFTIFAVSTQNML